MTVQKDFPRPPGGKLICEEGQTAFVRIKNGVVIASCSSPPSYLSIGLGNRYDDDFKRWVVATAKEEAFRRYGTLSTEVEEIFRAGAYEYIDTTGSRVRVEFKVPGLEQPEGGNEGMTM